MSLTWTVFEILGTVAFAFSGATVGLARGMDVFGIALLSVVTAVGGGILRDVLAGIFPPFALRGPDGIVLALVTAAAVCIGFRYFRGPCRGRKLVLFAYRVSDTAGLAAFTVTGVITAIHSYPGYRYVLPVLLGLITAVGGGILRDVLAQKVPVVLYEDVYAMASVLGSGVLLSAFCIRIQGLHMHRGAGSARYFFSASARSFSGGDSIIPQGCTAAEVDRRNESWQIVFDYLTAGKSIFIIFINSEIRGGGSW